MYQQRYRHILWFFAKIIASFIWWEVFLFRIGFRKQVRATRQERLRRIAVAFRKEAVRMGGVMIKVGQFLSARLDILPPIITEELAGLQDEVKPESVEDLMKVALEDFNQPLEEKFEYIDPQSLAAASIGQVHRARIRQNCEDPQAGPCEVIIKIQRPNIEHIIAVDLRALNVVAGWMMRYPPIRKRADVPALMTEFSRSLLEELDYLNEGKNAERFAENFQDHPEVFVPKVVWSHTTRHVLTLEFIDGIKITDYAAIEAAGIDRGQVAIKLFSTYLKQIFEDRFFHADPHPGNLFVVPLNETEASVAGQNWRLVFIDFGMTGTLSQGLMNSLREILIAVGTQDAKRIIKAYQTLGVILPGANLELIERATNLVFERFWGKTAPELMSMHKEEAVAFAREFGDLLYEMPFQIPQNLLLLGRCLGILSGLCTGLDANFNIWSNIGPYAQKLVAAEGGGGWRFWVGELTTIATLIGGLPRKTDTLLNRIEQGKLVVQVPETNERITHLERGLRQFSGAVVFTGFILGSVQTYLAQDMTATIILGAGAILSLLYTFFSR